MPNLSKPQPPTHFLTPYVRRAALPIALALTLFGALYWTRSRLPLTPAQREQGQKQAIRDALVTLENAAQSGDHATLLRLCQMQFLVYASTPPRRLKMSDFDWKNFKNSTIKPADLDWNRIKTWLRNQHGHWQFMPLASPEPPPGLPDAFMIGDMAGHDVLVSVQEHGKGWNTNWEVRFCFPMGVE